jgi:hypothetical protein
MRPGNISDEAMRTLERLMRPLNATLGRRRVGTDAIDVALVNRPSKLRVAWSLGCRGTVHSEDDGLIAVERQRLAMAGDVLAGSVEISECRLGGRKPNDHEAAGCIVDEYERGACPCATLEPVMFAAVDLNELAKAGSARPGLLNLRWPQLPWNPQPSANLKSPDRILADHDVIPPLELLSSQCWPEIRV